MDLALTEDERAFAANLDRILPLARPAAQEAGQAKREELASS